MGDTAATIFTAMAGGLFALSVAYIGYRAGRRQTTDQATVEHGQWLRGQRQQAYLAFADTWDLTMESVKGLQGSWEAMAEQCAQDPQGEDPVLTSGPLMDGAWRSVRREMDRVELLGPQQIDFAVRALENAFTEMRGVVADQAAMGAACPHWFRWEPALNRANMARFDFHAAVIRTLRRPPSPDGENEELDESLRYR